MLRRPARRLLGVATAILIAVVLSTCTEAPTQSRARHARVAVAPTYSAAVREVARDLAAAGLEIDKVSVTLLRGDTKVAEKLVDFPANVQEVKVELEVTLLADQEQLTANVELRSGSTPIFTGSGTVQVAADQPAPTPQPVEVKKYVGPGASATRLTASPAQSSVAVGKTQQIAAAAFDANGAPVNDLPIIAYESSDPTIATVSATGLAQATTKLGTVTISVRALNTLVATASLHVVGAPARLAVTSGGGQSGVVATTLPVPFAVQVLSAENEGVPGVSVAFQALTAGGTVATATATTDQQGVASTSITLGATAVAGGYTFQASVAGTPAVTPVSITASATAGVPAAIAIVSGNGQTGPAGTPLGQPFVVRVTDAHGNPVANATVTWTRLTGHGALATETSQTGENGQASVQYTLGAVAESETIRAQVNGVASGVTFTVGGVAGTGAAITLVSGDRQTGVVGTILGQLFVVRVTDNLGNPVSGATVSFVGTGVATSSTTTNADGLASTGITLGHAAGTQTFTAFLVGSEATPVTITATALAGAAARIAIVSGDGQVGTVGQLLAQPLIVRVTDSFGNSVGGATVTFTQASGAGTIGTPSVITDAEGRAGTAYTLGATAGASTVRAEVAGLTGVSVTFSMGGLAGGASKLVVLQTPNAPIKSGALFTLAPIIQVRDANDNIVAVAGISVVASVSSGYEVVGTTSVPTNVNGAATFTNLGIRGPVGTAVLTFSVSGTGATISINIGILAGDAASIAAASPTTLSGVAGAAVPAAQLPAVIVRDAANNPVPSASLTIAVTNGFIVPVGGGQPMKSFPATTNANGVATINSWMLSTTTGTDVVTMTLVGATGSPVTFTATVGPAAPASIVKSGDAQSATVGTSLSVPPAVTLRDAFNNVVPNVTVTFTVGANSGAVSSGGAFAQSVTVPTDASGVARVSWQLGTVAGSNTLTATPTGMAAVTFTATGLPGSASRLTLTTPPISPSPSGATFTSPVVVQILDGSGNAVAQSGVVVTATAGAGYVLGGTVTATTNAVGTATFANLSISGPAAPTTITFNAESMTSVTANVTVTTGAPATIAATVATTLGGVAGTLVPATQLPAVVVRDNGGNLVSGANVAFAASNGFLLDATGQQVKSIPIPTNANGVAAVSGWRLSTSVGNDIVSATLTATGSTVTFTATTIPGSAASVAVVSGNNQHAAAGLALAQPMIVLVTDVNGNAVAPGTTVTWVITVGTGSLAAATSITDASGRASMTFTTGAAAGQATIQASAGTGSMSFTEFGDVGAVSSLTKVAGDGLQAVANTTLATQPTVAARDQSGNPVPGIVVTFTVSQNNGAVSSGGAFATSASVRTDATGMARVTWRLGTSLGVNSLNASATGVATVTFTATGTVGPATKIGLTRAPSSPTASGAAFVTQPVVQLLDALDNAVGPGEAVITASAPAGYALVGASATTNSSGQAAFATLAVSGPVGAVTITFRAPDALGVAPATANVILSVGAPATIAATVPLTLTGLAGSSVPAVQLPSVVVKDGGGNLVPNASVTFSVTNGFLINAAGASVKSLSVGTNATGVATVFGWTLSTTPGSDVVTATSSGAAGSPVTFTADVTTALASALALVSGSPQHVVAGNPAPQPLVVRATDRFGNPAANVTIYWTVTNGGATLSSAETVTNADGRASVELVTGPFIETINVTASLTPSRSDPVVQFTIVTQAGAPARMILLAGADQQATVGTAVTNAPAVRIVDANDNGVEGVLVRFTVAAGSGTVTSESKITNSDGVASSDRWVLGTRAGEQTLTAAASELAVTFHANATPDRVANLQIVSGDGQVGSIGSALAQPLVARVSDRYGNAVSNLSVFWTRVLGGGSLGAPASLSNATGEASVTYVLGLEAGTEQVQAEVSGVDGSIVFTLTAKPRDASRLLLVGGNGQEGPVGTLLSEPLTVRVTDDVGNAVEGASVGWLVTAGDASLSATASRSDVAGAAEVRVSLGRLAGNVTVRATLNVGSSAVTIDFSLRALPGSPATIAKLDGDNQSAPTGASLPVAPMVRVSDGFGNVLGGVQVVFGPASGGGSVSGASPITDATGLARVGSWTLGSAAGAQTLPVSAGAVVATFTATARPTLTVAVVGNGSGRVTSAPTGIDCVLTDGAPSGVCSTVFDANVNIVLNAAPNAGNEFAGWGGSCSGAAACSVSLDRSRSVTATFSRLRTLTVAGIGSGSGRVTSSPAGIDCTVVAGATSGSCSAAFAATDLVTLTQRADASSLFDGWSGACTGTGSCAVTVDQSKSVTVSFTAVYSLTVAGGGSGSGTVTSNVGGIACTITGGAVSGSCSGTFTKGTVVTLSAAPSTNSLFTGWTGACSGSGGCTVTMDQIRPVTAAFTLAYKLAVQTVASNTGNGSVTGGGITCTVTAATTSGTCEGTYPAGSTVNLFASPSVGYAFAGWGGACAARTTSSTCTLTMSADQTVTAAFAVGVGLTVSSGGGSGTGTVSSSPSGISCRIAANGSGGACNAVFPLNSSVTLTASADQNYRFSGWGGGSCAGTGSCVVTMNQARTVTATFTLVQYSLSVVPSSTNRGNGSVVGGGINCTITYNGTTSTTSGVCSQVYNPSTAVTLTEAPVSGYAFTGWGSACSGTGTTCNLTMDRNTGVEVTFVRTARLTVTGTGSKAGGRITSSPNGIDCVIVPGGGTTGTCTAAFPIGTGSLELDASSVDNSVFGNWSGDCAGAGTNYYCLLDISVDRTVSANFVPGFQVTIGLGGTGDGWITSNPAGINCRLTAGVKSSSGCEHDFASGTAITLTASSFGTSTFSGWQSPCAVSAPGTICTIAQLAQNVTLSPTFSLTPSAWTALQSGTTRTLRGIWGYWVFASNPPTLYAVGDGGTILKSAGSGWSAISGVTLNSLKGVWGTTPTNLFSAGSGHVALHYDGTSWQQSFGATDYNGVGGASATTVFAVGINGFIARWDGTRWLTPERPVGFDLYGVWGRSDADAFAVGENGLVARWNGTSWTSMPKVTTATLLAVWGTSTDVFAVGGGGVILRFDGSSWTSMTSGTTVALYGVTGTSPTDVYAVGDYGVVLHYDGSQWSQVPSGTLSTLYGADAVVAKGVLASYYAVGAGGTILRR